MMNNQESIQIMGSETEESTKLALISRIFGYDKFIGHDKKCLKTNDYYYNDLFDELYDKTIPELEGIDQELHLQCEQYSKIINRYGTEKG